MIELPQLPADFYESDPVLGHIRRAAYAQFNPPSPDATLGVCLARVAASVPVGVTLPGVGGTVNFITGIVGNPGTGKSTAQRLGTSLIPDLGPKPLDSVPIGSGEGMVEKYLRTMRDKSSGETVTVKVQEWDSAYYYVDEAEGFINRTKTEASTTLSTLRTLWSGGDAGAMNAQVETSRHLRDGTYRFAATFGFQPTYAMQLLAGDKAGTPQRFLFVSATDREMPDVGPSDPGPLHIRLPRDGEIHVDNEIYRLITTKRRKVQRGEIQLDSIDAHRDYLQLRTAYLLSVLCGDDAGVIPKWWNLAGVMLDVSSGIISALREEQRREADAMRIASVEDKIERREIEDERTLNRIGALVMRYAAEAGEPQTWPNLQRRLRSTDRHRGDAGTYVALGYLRRSGSNQYVPGRVVDVDIWT